jgi:serine/threonine protein kinase
MKLPPQEVAIKLFRGVDADVSWTSFRREAEAIRTLQEQGGSDCIIHLLAALPTTNPPALIVELATRGDLLTYLRKNVSTSQQPTNVAELLGFAEQVCDPRLPCSMRIGLSLRPQRCAEIYRLVRNFVQTPLFHSKFLLLLLKLKPKICRCARCDHCGH